MVGALSEKSSLLAGGADQQARVSPGSKIVSQPQFPRIARCGLEPHNGASCGIAPTPQGADRVACVYGMAVHRYNPLADGPSRLRCRTAARDMHDSQPCRRSSEAE